MEETQKESTALVKTNGTALEIVQHPQGERALARGKKGKFIRKTEALTEISTKQLAELLLKKGENGKTTLQSLHEHIIEVAMAAKDEKSLIGLAKVLSQLEESAGISAQRDNMLRDEQVLQPMKVVIIAPTLMNPEVQNERPSAPAKTQPSWAEIEVGEIITNPAKK